MAALTEKLADLLEDLDLLNDTADGPLVMAFQRYAAQDGPVWIVYTLNPKAVHEQTTVWDKSEVFALVLGPEMGARER